MINCLTDNRQRTVAELRNILKKRDGNLGEPGCVTWIFEAKGVITIPRSAADEEALFMAAIDAGAEDMLTEDEEFFEIRTEPQELHKVIEAINALGLPHERAELTMIPTNSTAVPDDEAGKLLSLLDELDDHDDVQQVFANFEISDEFMAGLEAEG